MVSGVNTGLLPEFVDDAVQVDFSAWPDAAIADAYIELRRDIDRREALAARMLVTIEGRKIPYEHGATSIAAWSQWRTGQRSVEARASFDAGVACESLPLTAKAWEQGQISASLARTICRGLRPEYADVYQHIEEYLVHFAAERNISDLDGLIGYYRKHCDAADDREPCDDNGAHLSPVGGRWALNGNFDALGGGYLNRAMLAAMDPPSEGDDRTPAHRRADAWVRIAKFFLDHEDLPLEGGEAPHVALTVNLETILNWLPIPAVPRDPADLAALLSGAQRDQLLCDCNIARIILGPDSQPLDVGREHRTAPKWLRRAVAQRDRGCRYPGCDRTTNRCEIHHVIPWWNGGNTALDNLVCLCSFHHHVIHRPGWTNTLNRNTYTIHNEHRKRIE